MKRRRNSAAAGRKNGRSALGKQNSNQFRSWIAVAPLLRVVLLQSGTESGTDILAIMRSQMGYLAFI